MKEIPLITLGGLMPRTKLRDVVALLVISSGVALFLAGVVLGTVMFVSHLATQL